MLFLYEKKFYNERNIKEYDKDEMIKYITNINIKIFKGILYWKKIILKIYKYYF